MNGPAAGGAPKCPTPKKHRHATKGAALTALERLGEAYKCVCGVWHIGHRRGSLQQRIKDALRKEPRR